MRLRCPIRTERPELLFFVALTGLTAALVSAPSWAVSALAYSRPGVLGGELWRLVTGNLVHVTGRHLLWNLAGLAVIWLAVGPRLRSSEWTAAALLSSLGTSLGLLFFTPSVEIMVGLSAVLHGLLATGALVELRYGSRLGGALFLTLVGGKLLWEQLAGPLPGTAAALGDRIALDAHLWGAASGIGAGGALLLSRYRIGARIRSGSAPPSSAL